MKYRIAVAVLALMILPKSISALDPSALTNDEQTMISRSCKDAQRNLQRIQYVDPVTRVSRGNTTSNIVTLMSALNSRAASNTYNVPSLVAATNQVQQIRQQFADDYTSYEISLRDIVAMDCASKPVEFYQQLVQVRSKREILSVRVQEIEHQLDQFAQYIPDLRNLVKGQR